MQAKSHCTVVKAKPMDYHSDELGLASTNGWSCHVELNSLLTKL